MDNSKENEILTLGYEGHDENITLFIRWGKSLSKKVKVILGVDILWSVLGKIYCMIGDK